MEVKVHRQPLSDEKKEEIALLVDSLGSEDGGQREKARLALVKYGKAVTPYLVKALTNENRFVRWEAAKAFGTIKDPLAAPALVDALNDEDCAIGWLAAEALIALDRESIVPLLRGLISHFDSPVFRHGTHHVLHALERTGLLDEHTLKVLDSLRSIQPEMTAPFVAQKALAVLTKEDPHQTI